MNTYFVVLIFVACCFRFCASAVAEDLEMQKGRFLEKQSLLQQGLGLAGGSINALKIEESKDGDGNLMLLAPLTLPQVAYLNSRRNERSGGLSPDQKLCYQVTCEVLYQEPYNHKRDAFGNTSYVTRYFNMLGVVLYQTVHLSKTGFQAQPVTDVDRVFVKLNGNGSITFSVNYSQVHLDVFANKIARNAKVRSFLKKSELEPQLTAALNQLLVLNGTIENNQLVAGDPLRAKKRLLQLTTSGESKLKATLDVKRAEERKMLEDAHNNRGVYANVKGVPVGKILLPGQE